MACCVLQIIFCLITMLGISSTTTFSQPVPSPVCIPSIMVPRNTVWRAQEMIKLTINCSVVTEPPCFINVNVLWCKVYGNDCNYLNQSTPEWKPLNDTTGVSFLTFKNLSMEDAGLYRCKINGPIPSVSHSINVTVTDYIPTKNIDSEGALDTSKNKTTNDSQIQTGKLWQYIVYICGGVVLVIVLVLVLVLLYKGIKRSGNTKDKDNQAENQPTATPVADHAPPIPYSTPGNISNSLPARVSPPSPCIYDNTLCRVGSQKDRLSVGKHTTNQRLERQYRDQSDMVEEDEENALIYASLNHEVNSRNPPKVSYAEVNNSEYAAIKLS